MREVRRVGDYVHVRREDDSEGRLKAEAFESWLKGQRSPVAADVAELMARGQRRLMWQLLGLFGLLAAVGLGLLIMMLVYG